MSGNSEYDNIILEMRRLVSHMNAYNTHHWTEDELVHYFETVVEFAEANPRWLITRQVLEVKERWIEYHLIG